MKTPTKQRLALFLDGTWNTEDDSTNVLKAYHSTHEGLSPDNETTQLRYYDRGVGTNMFEKITGGGFGLGLQKNVLEAYNWLVDRYNTGDEIYIFGFSRGAYTARSLVGLIASCGLIKRGAPLTVTQLWNGYAFISKHRSKKEYSWWEKNLKKEKNKALFRRLTELEWTKGKKPFINDSEHLIYKWSKRVDITYLGIFDTVGALGIDALGIPGLHSKLDSNHNLNPTSLIKSCRHALAIDEHRTSFRLTPILDYVKNNEEKDIEQYKDIIEQRWFVGAHSNIGGGYANNVLSMRPFDWVMEGAKGLQQIKHSKDDFPKGSKTAIPERKDIRDSYAELAGIFWPHIFREKRNLRPIGRSDLVRSGYSLRTIDEKVDKTVFELAQKSTDYSPPNLLAYFRLHPDKDKDGLFENRQPKQKWPGDTLVYTDEKHWLKTKLSPRLLLILWSIVAAFGISGICQFLGGVSFSSNQYWLTIVAGMFVLIDWIEARLTVETNIHPKAVRLKVFWNIFFWARFIGIAAFFVGLISALIIAIQSAQTIDFSLQSILMYFKTLLIPIFTIENILLFASTAAVIAMIDIFGKKSFSYQEFQFIKDLDPSQFAASKKVITPPESNNSNQEENKKSNSNIILIGFGIVAITTSLFLLYEPYRKQVNILSNHELLIDQLLLIYVLIFILFSLYNWVGKPMDKSETNLGSIVALQKVYNSDQLTSLLNEWMNRLSRKWLTNEDHKTLNKICLKDANRTIEDNQKVMAWWRLREILRTALWRDLIGFIPLYSLILFTILYIGSNMIGYNQIDSPYYHLFSTIPLLTLILVTAFADIGETSIHLKYIKNHSTGGSSPQLVWIGMIFTILKFIGLLTAGVMAIAVVISLSTALLLEPIHELKGMIIAGLIYFIVISLGLNLPQLIYQFFKDMFEKQEQEDKSA